MGDTSKVGVLEPLNGLSLFWCQTLDMTSPAGLKAYSNEQEPLGVFMRDYRLPLQQFGDRNRGLMCSSGVAPDLFTFVVVPAVVSLIKQGPPWEFVQSGERESHCFLIDYSLLNSALGACLCCCLEVRMVN